MINLADIHHAAHRLAGIAHHTPLLPAPCGDLLLKPECLQPVGAFKIRGAFNAVAALEPRQRAAGIVAHSSGNHAQAAAFAARHFGILAHVVIPDTAPPNKVAATRAYGAIVHLVPPDQRLVTAEQLVKDLGMTLIPSFDHPQVIAGQGTIGLEIAADAPDTVDSVLVPVSGGGLISGIAVALKALRPQLRIIGVEPALAADAADSLHSGRLRGWDHQLTERTVADGLRIPALGKLPWQHISQLVDDIVTVSEDEILAATRLLLRQAHLVVEPSGAVATAAHLYRSAELGPGLRIAIVSGGNIEPALLSALLGEP